MSRTIVFITGANQGIGFAVAQQLLTSQPTYHVLLGSRDAQLGAEAVTQLVDDSKRVECVSIDVTDDESIVRAAEQVRTRYGVVDVLINNAGINNEIAIPADDKRSMRERFREAYEVNVFGAAQTTEAFRPLLEKSTNPRIVFVSSHTGSLGLRVDRDNAWYESLHRPLSPIYRSSKAALNMLTLHYAALFEDKGGKVNATCPNRTATGFMKGLSVPGARPASESARNIVRLATLGKDGETGTNSDETGIMPW
ncbi:hypothetical protein ASPZODRAFT_61151 [Penicilliopsis zonata CBS 506.65]|uniref:Uncharacterized protein n=1 Tax=Penicilliopsis zonata CBS 506.65 TaxID=1073090 RepID=A0A1L9SPG8_9EURO|nr:hypothetical protein ASPZODRAFT_61151 [Penicilliopsis zonata CBS 506.65]OJJ49135.1 hypothetical protein ASPZODRAFT_61151 [Penicilliopsis zonata CBS 506.65]